MPLAHQALPSANVSALFALRDGGLYVGYSFGVVRQDVPESLATAVERALALDPADRFASATAFAAAMNVAESDERDGTPAPVAAPPHAAPSSPDVRHVSRLMLALGAVAFAIAGGGAIFALLHARPVAAPLLDARRVVVAALSNETGNQAMDPIGSLVTARIRDGLTATRLRVVMSSFAIPALHDTRMAGGSLDDPERVGTLAAETHATTVISGSYYLMAGKVEFLLEITDARSGELLDSRGTAPVIWRRPSTVP